MPIKVADASVLAAITFGEPRAEEAEALLQDAFLYEPPLLVYELASVAHKLEIQWVDVDHRAVLHLALERGLTTYDATYLFVARSLGAPLVTFDLQLMAASQDTH